jgi:tight adherence protein B
MEPLILAIGVFLFVIFIVFGIYYLIGIAPEADKRRRMKSRLMELSGATIEDIKEEFDLVKNEQISSVPAFQRVLSRFSQTNRLQKLINQADMKLNVGVFVLLTLIAFVGGFLVCQYLIHFFIINLLAGAGIAFLPLLAVLYKRKKRFGKFEAIFPEALELLTRAVLAGHAFNTGIEMIAQEMADPVGKEFRITFDEQNFGLPLKQALFNMVERMPLIDLRFFVTAILMQKETGGNLAEILTNLSRLIRERFKIMGEVRTFSAQGRLTGYILTALPITVALAISFLNWEYMKPLFLTVPGHYLLAVGAFGQILGYVVIRKIVNIKV